MSITSLILSLGLVVLPFFYWEVPKVWITLRFVELFFIIVVFNLYNKTIPKLSKNNMVISLLIFIFIAFISSLLGVDLSKSIFGNLYRSDGLITLFHLASFSILISLVYKNSWNFIISLSIFLGSTMASIFNNFGQPNFLAGFILISFPFGLYLYRRLTNKFLRSLVLIGLFIQLIRLIFTYSYAGMIGLLIIYFFWKSISINRIYKSWLFMISVLIVLLISTWFINLKLNKEYVAESRARIYRNIFLGSLQRPILGYGWANVDYAFESVIWPIKFNDDVYVDKAHMLFLEIFSATGVVGLTVYLYFIYLILVKLIKKRSLWNNVLLTSLISYLVYSQTNVTSISYEFIFWLIIGIVLSL